MRHLNTIIHNTEGFYTIQIQQQKYGENINKYELEDETDEARWNQFSDAARGLLSSQSTVEEINTPRL